MMSIDEFKATDAVLQNVLNSLVVQINSHESKRCGEYAALEQRTSWNGIRLKLYEEYNKVNQQRMDLAKSFAEEASSRSMIINEVTASA